MLMLVDARLPEVTNPIRSQINQLYAPVYATVAWPNRFFTWLGDITMTDEAVRQENLYLRSQILVLSGRVQKLSELAAENARLRGLIDSNLVVDGRVMIAEIIGVDPDPYRQLLLLNKGQDDGVFVGQTVLDAKGIMGQVIEVSPETSRLMLIADREHAIPVRVARNGIRAVLAGTGDTDKLALQYVPDSADVKPGDLLLSSGLGTRFPAGYPVATVTKVGKSDSNEFAAISAKPVAELDRSRHVLLISSGSLRHEQEAHHGRAH